MPRASFIACAGRGPPIPRPATLELSRRHGHFRSGYQEKTPTKLPLSSLPHRQLEPRGGTRQLKWFEHNERIHVTARRVIEGERENANDFEAQ